MAWPHLEKAKQQHYKAGLDVELSGQAKDGEAKNDMQMKLSWHNWRRLLRTGDVGEKLRMAYAPGGAEGLNK